MPARDAGQLVLWPHYFDKSLTRQQGRRVASSAAVDRPRAGDIAKAARSLGLKVELADDMKPPRFWYDQKGAVLVSGAKEPKQAILNQVASRL